MIVLKILLWILLAVIGIIVLILLLPVRGAVSYIDNKLTYSAHYSFILLYNSDKKGVVAWYLNRKKKRDEMKKKKEEAENAQYEPEVPASSKPPLEEKPPEPEKPPQTSDTKPESEKPPAETFDDIDEPFIEEEESGKKKKKKAKKKKEKPPKTIMEKAEFVLNIIRESDRAVLRLFKGFKIYGLYIDFIIANEDAYKCALNYGRISGALYNVLAWMSVLFNVKLKTIDINPGFAVDKPRWDAAAKIKFRPMTAVAAGTGLLLTYTFRSFIPGFFRERKLRKSAARQK